MNISKSKQMIAGKSFEYALLIQFEERLKTKTSLEVINNTSFKVAKECYDSLSDSKKSEYLISASFAVNFLIDIEPRLSNSTGHDDVLQLEILPDSHGESGDVRDILVIRLLQKWEIGVSAKNNHHAVKHSRLSANIDFGKKWLRLPSSKSYFDAIKPIFSKLEDIRKGSERQKKWKELGDYHSAFYVPILKAFMNELLKLNRKNPQEVASRLVTYIVGNKDFYKVIKGKNKIEIQAYNMSGALNASFGSLYPKYKVSRIPLPTKIIDVTFVENSKTTIMVTMDNDWILSFRIHNASSRVESSLKFDINLLKSPKQLFKNTFNINHI